jgi:hypothetical protein
MTKFVVLPAEAFQQKEKRPRSSYLAEYRSYLTDLATGEGGELILDAGEKKATIKNRLKHAARVEDKQLRYLRTGVDRVRFQVMVPSEQLELLPEEPKEEPAPTKVKGRGRKAS